jgi:hypothetical protein
MSVAAEIDECEGEDHPGDTPTANVRNILARKPGAVAETIGVLDAPKLV